MEGIEGRERERDHVGNEVPVESCVDPRHRKRRLSLQTTQVVCVVIKVQALEASSRLFLWYIDRAVGGMFGLLPDVFASECARPCCRTFCCADQAQCATRDGHHQQHTS